MFSVFNIKFASCHVKIIFIKTNGMLRKIISNKYNTPSIEFTKIGPKFLVERGNLNLVVTGNARVTGILTVGTGSLTITDRDINAAGVIPAELCSPPKNIGMYLILNEPFFSN